MKLKSCILLITIFIYFGAFDSTYGASLKGKLISSNQDIDSYRILAIGKKSDSAIYNVATNGKFSVKAKKGRTLHLVSSDGRYFGPIGAAKGSKFIARLSGKGGNLGKVSLKSNFATVKYNKKSKRYFSGGKVAFNSSTGPSGAGKFGLVQLQTSSTSNTSKASTKASSDADLGDDTDKDGLPDILDIDDDGDLILDITDTVAHKDAKFDSEIFSTLRLEINDSLNVNISSATEDDIDQLISDNLILQLLLRNNTNSSVSAVNVDCQSLSYCSGSTGTATIRMDNGPVAEGELWRSYDPDSDGLPNLDVSSTPATIGIKPHATRSEVRTGDTILFKLTTSAGAQTVPAILPFIFASTPALKEYTNGVTTTAISYPVSETGLGTATNPIVVSNQQIGLTFWKPQRSNIDGAEDPGFIDIGKLYYGVYLSVEGSSDVYTCLSSEYSSLSSTLEVLDNPSGAEVLQDTAVDAPASSSNTLSYTLDFVSCLSRQGVTIIGTKFHVDLVATSASQDQTSQGLYFRYSPT